jgi:hypothetical protein
MRTSRLISTTAAILLLGAGVVSAQGIKTDQPSSVPAAQQNAPAEKVAPAVKSDQLKAPDKTGQAAPIAAKSDNKQLTTDKSASAGDAARDSAAKGPSGADGRANVTSKRAVHYASGRREPLYDVGYRDDRGCRSHRHAWTPWLWC